MQKKRSACTGSTGSATGKSRHFTIALAGNPNTGKSTVFNALTGLRQHTGNWPGKTVVRTKGRFSNRDARFSIVDLPGIYSLYAASPDEEVAVDHLLSDTPDITIIVMDANRLERNLQLVLQILEISNEVIVCLNLMDESRRHGVEIDARKLSSLLGVPVIPTSARYKQGIEELIEAISKIVRAPSSRRHHGLDRLPSSLKLAATKAKKKLEAVGVVSTGRVWFALRLLEKDPHMQDLLLSLYPGNDTETVIHEIASIGDEFNTDIHECVMQATAKEASHIQAVVTGKEKRSFRDLTRLIDSVVTHKFWAFPIMFALFALVFWITISAANYPSSLLSRLLIGEGYPLLKHLVSDIGFPVWLQGLLVDGIYLATAWVISVMLPPMAIFFPLFTLLEDFGYLPRVAFNLDRIYNRVGAHGKQSLTMMMGFGCNAAGIIATRIIDSPRERLIAIITNNFALCNGRWPTLILIATLFIGSLVPPYLAGIVTAGVVVSIAAIGIALSLLVSWGLYRTVLKGEVSSFSLELPPYRPPRFFKTLYTSLIDRTLFVLWRAIVFAIPAGAFIWLISNINISGQPLAKHLINIFDPVGILVGLNGVILLAYIVAIPANEIVIPTILMFIVMVTGNTEVGKGHGVMFEFDSLASTMALLKSNGWTLLTAINLMIFSLVHNPCSTTIYTIKKETGSWKWTLIATFLPLVMGFLLIFIIATIWRFFS